MMKDTPFDNRAGSYCDVEGKDSAFEATTENHVRGDNVAFHVTPHAQHHATCVDPADDAAKNLNLTKRIQFSAYRQRPTKHGNIFLGDILGCEVGFFPERC